MSPWQRSNTNTRQLAWLLGMTIICSATISVAQQTCKEVFDDGGDGDGILAWRDAPANHTIPWRLDTGKNYIENDLITKT